MSTTAGSLGTVTDNANGTYTAILTSSASIETATITGTLDTNPFTDNATVDFTALFPATTADEDAPAGLSESPQAPNPSPSVFRPESPSLHRW